MLELNKTLHIKLDEERMFWFHAEAKARGLKLSNLMRKAAILYMGLSPEFLDSTKEVADEMGVTQSAFFESTITDMMCQNAAFKAVFGTAGANASRPFRWDQDGKLLRGEELAKVLFDEYVEIFKRFQILLVEQLESKEAGFRVTPEVFQMALSQTQREQHGTQIHE